MTIINSPHILLCCREIVPGGRAVYFYVKMGPRAQGKGISGVPGSHSPPHATFGQELASAHVVPAHPVPPVHGTLLLTRLRFPHQPRSRLLALKKRETRWFEVLIHRLFRYWGRP